MCSEEWEERFPGVGVVSSEIESSHTCAKGVTEGFVLSTQYVRLHAYGTKEGGILSSFNFYLEVLVERLVLEAWWLQACKR